jgi:4-amino-4-deoxy-L-arabinose transferase-like glycosyltransferase
MTKTHSAFRTPHSAIVWALFALAIIAVYFFGLNIPLLGPDEPRYAQVAREMFERGDWVTPTLGGFNWFEKPALLYWLEIVSYKLFGVSEFAARFGSALFGLGTILSLWLLGRHSEMDPKTEGQKLKTEFANWLALIAASTIGIIVFSRGASFDIILTFPMTASLVSFYIFDQSHSASPRLRVSTSLFAFYFFIGVSLLAKGLVGVVFPFAIVAFYYLLSWRFPSKAFVASLFWGTLVTIAVAATWYLPMYQRYGYEFIEQFFIEHHFQRFTSNKYFHPQPFYFFFWVLPLMTIPWLPFFLAAVWSFAKNIIRRVAPSPIIIFSFAWLAVPLVFFSFSGSKLPGYILPAVPAAIIIIAEYVFGFVRKSKFRRVSIQSVAVATFIAVVISIVFFLPGFAETDSVKSLIKAADERGMSRSAVLAMHTVSHNAEFYAAGRLVRDADGNQKKFIGTGDVLDEIRRENGKDVLVLIPLEYLKELTGSSNLRSEVLKDNGELAIVAVTAK